MIINNVRNQINFKDKRNIPKMKNLETFKRNHDHNANILCANNVESEINLRKKKEKGQIEIKRTGG